MITPALLEIFGTTNVQIAMIIVDIVERWNGWEIIGLFQRTIWETVESEERWL
jgi:hypothetical protein